jgi:hypothetical protein
LALNGSLNILEHGLSVVFIAGRIIRLLTHKLHVLRVEQILVNLRNSSHFLLHIGSHVALAPVVLEEFAAQRIAYERLILLF